MKNGKGDCTVTVKDLYGNINFTYQYISITIGLWMLNGRSQKSGVHIRKAYI